MWIEIFFLSKEWHCSFHNSKWVDVIFKTVVFHNFLKKDMETCFIYLTAHTHTENQMFFMEKKVAPNSTWVIILEILYIVLADILRVSFTGSSRMSDLALTCQLLHCPSPSSLSWPSQEYTRNQLIWKDFCQISQKAWIRRLSSFHTCRRYGHQDVHINMLVQPNDACGNYMVHSYTFYHIMQTESITVLFWPLMSHPAAKFWVRSHPSLELLRGVAERVYF